MSRRRRHSLRSGYVMVVVLVLIAILSSAGAYGLKGLEGEIRSTSSMKQSLTLARAAEAGAAHRLAELATTSGQAGVALTANASQTAWQAWPPQVTSNTEWNTYVAERVKYRVDARPVVTLARPPAGEAIGSGGQMTIWEINSYAINDTGTLTKVTVGEHAVSVGLRVWSWGGTTYAANN